MTYFGFLIGFVVMPAVVFMMLNWLLAARGRQVMAGLRSRTAWVVILGHVVVALIYTTPWDNYLVATRVWWYDPELVTGIILGWVPLEEYCFFIVQTIMTGSFLLLLARFVRVDSGNGLRAGWRRGSVLALMPFWLMSIVILVTGWQPGNYLALELVWALPPIMLQVAFGGDILWRYRRVVMPTLIISSLWLSGADALAIESGTWTINPEKSLNVLLGGVLPIEEFIFFLLTNTLVVFGTTLVLAEESQVRASTGRFAFLRALAAPSKQVAQPTGSAQWSQEVK